MEQEHRECGSQVQHLRTQLEKAHSSLVSQELELERLRPFESLLGQQQQVSEGGMKRCPFGRLYKP